MSKPSSSNLQLSCLNLRELLKNTYFLHKEKYQQWLISKRLTMRYVNSMKVTLENTFKLNFSTPIELRDEIKKVKNRKYRALALRNLFNFCEEYELIGNDLLIQLKNKIKITERSNIDSYVPNEDEMQTFLKRIKEYSLIDYIVVSIMRESGCRVSELSTLLKTIDIEKAEIINNQFVIYDQFNNQNNKQSFYTFLSYGTYNLIKENFTAIKKYKIEKLKTYIKRNKLIPLKYMRKYNFTLLIKSGVQFDIANFIQGRCSRNIGFNHYLAKKEVAVREYKKLL